MADCFPLADRSLFTDAMKSSAELSAEAYHFRNGDLHRPWPFAAKDLRYCVKAQDLMVQHLFRSQLSFSDYPRTASRKLPSSSRRSHLTCI